jgi:hypothetical protein
MIPLVPTNVGVLPGAYFLWEIAMHKRLRTNIWLFIAALLASVAASAWAQPVKNVTLVCGGFTSNICTDLEQVAADGTLTPYTGPPSGSVLVVTDFTWKAASITPGQVAFATLHHQSTSPPRDVAFSTAVATPDGAAVSQSHFNSGLLFSDMPIVFVSHTPNVAILLGYFAKQ